MLEEETDTGEEELFSRLRTDDFCVSQIPSRKQKALLVWGS